MPYSLDSTSLLQNIQSYLRNITNGAEALLVGTAHILKRSLKKSLFTIFSSKGIQVQQVSRAVKPDSVFVEHCSQRSSEGSVMC